MREPTLELSIWDRGVQALAHPVRALAWMVAIGAFVGPLGGVSWVLVGAVAVVLGLVIGELAGRSRVRTVWLVGVPVGMVLAGQVGRWLLTDLAVFPGLLGPSGALWASYLLGVGTIVASVTGLLRVLSVRGPAYQAVELFLLGGLLADGVASHRDGSIARPLWLSDLSWSFGVDPGRVLLAGGGMLAVLLVALLLLGAQRRKPGPGLLVLPIVAVIAWLVASQLPVLDPPDPERLFAEAGGEEPGAGGEGEDSEPAQPEPDDNGAGAKPEPDDNGGGGKPEPDDNGEPAKPQSGEGDPTESDGSSDESSDEAPDPLEGGGGGGADSPIAVVLIEDDYAPPSGYWYLRQGVLLDYNGTRLVDSSLPGAHDDILDHFAVIEESLPYQAPLEFRTAVHGSVSLLVEHPNPFGPEAPVRFAPRPNPNPARFDRSFSFVSHMLTAEYVDLVGRGVGDPGWSEELRAQYLEVPDDPRYLELAEQIRDSIDPTVPEEVRADPFVQAATITKWLGENMKYSKAARHAEAADPTADFLFGNRIGYCVHSAHASVYLWRELGIPARIATGYAVEEDSRRGSTLVVPSSSAHAWSELYVQGVGWVPLDVSPSENLDPEGEPADEEANEMLGEMARQQPAQPPGPRPDYSWIWRLLGTLTGGSVSTLLLLVLLGHGFVKLWRRARPLWASPKALSRVGYRAGLDMLTDAGLVRERGETREAFSRRLGLPALEEMTALHLRGALGGPVEPGDRGRSRAEWTGLLARLRVEIAGVRPWWRRWLGWVDPTSVYRTR